MNKTEIAEQYNINEHGVITSSGKFEGEMYYAVNFWGCALDGFCDRDEVLEDGTIVAIFDLDAQDYKDYPELEGNTILSIWENDNGFVFCTVE